MERYHLDFRMYVIRVECYLQEAASGLKSASLHVKLDVQSYRKHDRCNHLFTLRLRRADYRQHPRAGLTVASNLHVQSYRGVSKVVTVCQTVSTMSPNYKLLVRL